MRSKLNLPSTDRRVADKLEISGMPLSPMPMEWLDAGSWRLPSGKALAEFALQAGFLAPLLFNMEQFGSQAGASSMRYLDDAAAPAANKQFGKGSNQ